LSGQGAALSGGRFNRKGEATLYLALDAMTDASPDAHAHSIAHIFPKLGETGMTQDILDLLAKGSA